MRKFITVLAFIFISIVVLLKCSGNGHMFKALKSTYMDGKKGPTIDDLYIFERRILESGRLEPVPYGLANDYYITDSVAWKGMESYDPIAFVILQNNTMIRQQYWRGYSDASLTNSFSAAKSVVGLAILKAINLGHIENLEQKVIDFIPELDGDFREDVTIRHLLTMTSGIDFNESYGDPFGFMARAYYGTDLEDKTLSYDADIEPGSEWDYLGGNTILLSIIVSRSSNMTLSLFVEKYFWQPLGATQDAMWSLDEKDGIEKAYCCFYTNALDFARFGLIVQNMGTVFQKKIISSDLIEELQKPVILNNGDTIPHYGLHWWRIEYEGVVVSYARGIFGQYIIAIPDYKIVMTRLGTRRGEKDEFNHPVDLYFYLQLAKSFHDQADAIKTF